MRKDFNVVLKEQRKHIGFTQKQLAEKSGLSEITIRKYEKGERIPKIEQLDKLAQCLNCHIVDFMSAEEQNLFYFNELQIYMTKVLTNPNHPANNLASIMLSILTHISQVAPLDESKITTDDKEYCNSISKVLEQLENSLCIPDDDLNAYKEFMNSVTNFMQERYSNYFRNHYSNKEGE